jgi:hypothetical protein
MRKAAGGWLGQAVIAVSGAMLMSRARLRPEALARVAP